jgi:hypothetical protein
LSLTLAVNDRNDLFLGADGNLATNADLDAAMQACAHAARTLLAEMMYAADQGIPYFDVVWNGNANPLQFEAFLRRALLAVEGVIQIAALSVAQTDNTLRYTATIQTVYGVGTLNG